MPEKRKVPELITMWGVLGSILTELFNIVRSLGGSDEDIYRLATPEGRQTLEAMAKLIVTERKSSSTTHTVIGNGALLTSQINSGWKVQRHHCCCTGDVQLEKRSDGNLYLNGTKIERYLSPVQQNGQIIRGYELCKELADKPVLCVCVLDYLLNHQELIPDDWKTGRTYFWGTILRDPDGRTHIAYLCWCGKQWCWYSSCLGRDWNDGDSAAVRTNKQLEL